MLVLTTRIGEDLVIGDNIHIAVLEVRGGRAILGVKAPRSVSIDRSEVHQRRTAEELAVVAVDGESVDIS